MEIYLLIMVFNRIIVITNNSYDEKNCGKGRNDRLNRIYHFSCNNLNIFYTRFNNYIIVIHKMNNSLVTIGMLYSIKYFLSTTVLNSLSCFNSNIRFLCLPNSLSLTQSASLRSPSQYFHSFALSLKRFFMPTR